MHSHTLAPDVRAVLSRAHCLVFTGLSREQALAQALMECPLTRSQSTFLEEVTAEVTREEWVLPRPYMRNGVRVQTVSPFESVAVRFM